MSLKVAGFNKYGNLFAKSNIEAQEELRTPSIDPPGDSGIDLSSCISFSVYKSHAVWINKDGDVFAIGSNKGHKIIHDIPDGTLDKATKIIIPTPEGHRAKAISAVCGGKYTLYMLEPAIDGGIPQLAYQYSKVTIDNPLFLNLQGHRPVSLYGGKQTAAAIDDKGSAIIITRAIFEASNSGTPFFIPMPEGEKAVYLACGDDLVLALSASGRVFSSMAMDANDRSGFTEFVEVPELRDISISQISGTSTYFFAVSKDNRVFVCGSNASGRIGEMMKDDKLPVIVDDAFENRKPKLDPPFNQFREIDIFKPNKIVAAYAGCLHSLFLTDKGGILSCGDNTYGQLMLYRPGRNPIYPPNQTLIEYHANCCIAGNSISVVFIDCQPPSHSPNCKIEV